MNLLKVYRCLCDPTRLRILNLLRDGELCVCHIQEILGESQVKVSKHLAYLRAHGMAEARREGNWMVYRLPRRPSGGISANLACLQDCAREVRVFGRDSARLRSLKAKFERSSPICCAPEARAGKPCGRSAA
jgi:ArsR family transcriptional regulator